jgi:hypothetical protein
MQNNFVVFCLALVLRLLQNGLKLVGGTFVIRRERAAGLGLGALSLSVDLDSARLDAVSRSLLWGAALPIPGPARAPGSPSVPVPCRPLWHGPRSETFHGRDHLT